MCNNKQFTFLPTTAHATTDIRSPFWPAAVSADMTVAKTWRISATANSKLNSKPRPMGK